MNTSGKSEISGYRLPVFFISICCFVLSVNAQTVYLYTPNGSSVEAFRLSEMSPSEIIYINNYCAQTYPQAEILKSASATYNCHSYAWNMIEGGITCWLNQDPDLHRYWDDGSYIQTTEQYADKIFYYSGDHSAIQSKTYPDKYESKWGAWPLVRHAPGYGPYDLMQNRRYYRKSCYLELVNQTISTNKVIESCNDVFNVRNVTINSGVNVTIKAPQTVVISQNFRAMEGSVVSIKPTLTNTIELSEFVSDIDSYSMPDVEAVPDETIENNRMQDACLQIGQNPSDGSAVVYYRLPSDAGSAAVCILDMTGRMVKQIPIQEKHASSIRIGSDEFVSGIYICSLVVDGSILESKKMVLTN